MIQKPVLIYDGECTLCTRFKQTVERFDVDHKLTYVSIHQDEIYTELPLTKEECHKVIHLVDENNQVYKGPDVIRYLAHLFPMVNNLAWMLETDVGKKALDFFYQKVNDIRNSQINSCNKCKDE